VRFSDEVLLENLEHIWEVLGRQPRSADIARPFSICSRKTYADRFGSFRKALEAFVASFENQEPEQSDAPAEESSVEKMVVAATKRHRTSRNVSYRMRFLVMRRDDFKCRICGTSPAINPGTVLDVDHIVPWAAGGETEMENLQTLCEPCNGGKSDSPMNVQQQSIARRPCASDRRQSSAS
jgi:hypothetical protein